MMEEQPAHSLPFFVLKDKIKNKKLSAGIGTSKRRGGSCCCIVVVAILDTANTVSHLLDQLGVRVPGSTG